MVTSDGNRHVAPGEEKLKIGVLYSHPFGRRVINNLINKQNFCILCGPLCINCREHYEWFANKIHYICEIPAEICEDFQDCEAFIREKLQPLDVLLIIGVPESVLINTPDLLSEYKIKGAIYPVEDPTWITPRQQMELQLELSRAGIIYAFPRPFCSLDADSLSTPPLLAHFVREFRCGKPKFQMIMNGTRIMGARIESSSPCGITYYLIQYLRNEQYNTWNSESFEKRVSTALNQYPCIAPRIRDPVIEVITRVKAEEIAHKTVDMGLNNRLSM
jgi:hypothetical protein